jgi:hypothetical protein
VVPQKEDEMKVKTEVKESLEERDARLAGMTKEERMKAIFKENMIFAFEMGKMAGERIASRDKARRALGVAYENRFRDRIRYEAIDFLRGMGALPPRKKAP